MATTSLVAAEPFLIKQEYEKYTAEQHSVWSELVRRRLPQVRDYACREYLEGYDIIGLSKDRLPNLREISGRLKAQDWLEHHTRERIPSGRCVF